MGLLDFCCSILGNFTSCSGLMVLMVVFRVGAWALDFFIPIFVH